MWATLHGSVKRLAAAASPLGAPLERAARHQRHLVPVLTYHRVVEADGLEQACPATVSATVDQLRAQLHFIAAKRHALGAEELLAVRRGQLDPPPGSIVITFDDGYADFATVVWPLLHELGLPALLFVPTDLVADPTGGFWWDRLWTALLHTARPTTGATLVGELPLTTRDQVERAHRSIRARLKELPHHELLDQLDRLVERLGHTGVPPAVVTWDELRRLHRDGLAVCPHSASHPILTQLSPSALWDELNRPMQALRAELGSCPPILAYPGGAVDARVVEHARAAGYEMAFTTRRGLVDLRRVDWYRLERVNVSHRHPHGALRAQLSPRVAHLVGALE